jgi:hypothetical protein
VVPEDQAGDGLQLRDGRAGEHGKSVMIASAGSFDESSLVHRDPSCRAACAAASIVLASWSGKSFPHFSRRRRQMIESHGAVAQACGEAGDRRDR